MALERSTGLIPRVNLRYEYEREENAMGVPAIVSSTFLIALTSRWK
ncbi:MAG: hypothetical protein LH606_20070 [Cytophagaceae bacterium]|nr:hypothetical protein [Cytophagaceae bacterium]